MSKLSLLPAELPWLRRPTAARRLLSSGVAAVFLAASVATPLVERHAFAQPRPDDTRTRMFLFPLSQSADVSRITTTRLEQHLRDALDLNDGIHMLKDPDLIIAIKPEASVKTQTNAKIDEADALVWKGKELLEKKQAQPAAEALQRAVELYRDNYADLVDYDKLVDASVQLAEAFFRAGYDDNGAEALAGALSLRPTLTVDKRLQDKKFVAALEKLEAEAETHKPGQLSVSSSPPGAKVFIDGVLRGATPLVVSDLRKGTHYIQLRLDGYLVKAQTVRAPMGDQRDQIAALLDVDPAQGGGNVEGEYISPEPLLPYAESGNFNDNFRRAAKTFTERAFVENLVYGYVTRAADGYVLHLFMYSQKAAEIAALNPISFDPELTNAQLRVLDAVQAVVAGAAAFPTHRIVLDPPPAVYRSAAVAPVAVAVGPVVPEGPTPGVVSVLGDYPSLDVYPAVDPETSGLTETTGGDETEWYETWWFWTLVGVGVAGAGVGIAAGAGAFDTGSSSAPAGFGGAIQLP